jgi:hypothetical protein
MTQPQLNISFARHERDKGIEKARRNADRVCDKWSEKVYILLKDFIKVYSGPFQFEDFRVSIAGLVPEPPHKRAFGSIAARAAREGIITRVGYAPVKSVNCHRANASVWKKT